MPLPESVRDILSSIGQAAAEVTCECEGCREFVSIYKVPGYSVQNRAERLPYFARADFIYRICRFRVRSELIEFDVNVSPDDLWDAQEMYFTDEDLLEQVLLMWQVEPSRLGRPVDCAIPL